MLRDERRENDEPNMACFHGINNCFHYEKKWGESQHPVDI